MAPPPPAPDPAILDRNLKSLRTTDPDLADRLTHLDISPFNPTPALTRDGHLSLRYTHPGGQTQWLGRSSIPAARAAVLMEQFDPGQANVLLPAFGEGTEAETLLRKLEPHRAVFIWDPDLLTIRLVLALHDFAAPLAACRLVILQCSIQALGSTLSAWLAGHPSIQCPNRLMMWPWQTPVELSECRSAVEAAWHQSTAAR